MSANLYPLFLSLRGRCCVVVGGSDMAEQKTRELLDAGARLRLIALEVTNQISAWAKAGMLQWDARAYQTGDLRDAFLVVSVAGAKTNAVVFADAEKRQIFCNSVDDIQSCNCYASAVVHRGPLQIAISTGGNSPALAQRLRMELQQQFDEEYGSWVRQLGETRSLVLQDEALNRETRRKILHEQAGAAAFAAFQDSHREADSHKAGIANTEGSGESFGNA